MALPTSGSAGVANDSSDAHPDFAAAGSHTSNADIAQAFRDLARGEQTALALESNLTSLERKLNDFLASFEETERQKVEAVEGNKTCGESDGKKSS